MHRWACAFALMATASFVTPASAAIVSFEASGTGQGSVFDYESGQETLYQDMVGNLRISIDTAKAAQSVQSNDPDFYQAFADTNNQSFLTAELSVNNSPLYSLTGSSFSYYDTYYGNGPRRVLLSAYFRNGGQYEYYDNGNVKSLDYIDMAVDMSLDGDDIQVATADDGVIVPTDFGVLSLAGYQVYGVYARYEFAEDGTVTYALNEGRDFRVQVTSAVGVGGPQAVPEPASIAFLGLGVLGLGLYRRRRRPPGPSSSTGSLRSTVIIERGCWPSFRLHHAL